MDQVLSPSSEMDTSVVLSASPVDKENSALDGASQSAAEAAARKLFQEEMQRQEEALRARQHRKRKRKEQEEYLKIVRRRIEAEEELVDANETTSVEHGQELYALFNDLQCISTKYGLDLSMPELVVVGMQSDGKSTFVEALLGFQFNIVESNIGTRRPLIIQMVNDQACSTPQCRFRTLINGVNCHSANSEENSGPAPSEPVVPVERLAEEIRRQTDLVAGVGDSVSPIPIILQVSYSKCATLTIWDMPGFRMQGDERLSSSIREMVIEAMRPRNRVIICVEQSTVEWSNSLSRPIVRSVDPDFSRTVLVNTKFDNRVKELRSKEACDKYLAGEGATATKRPFYISLPVERDLDPDEFKEAIKQCHLSSYEQLLRIKFDEKRFATQIGFYSTKTYLEKLLHARYHDALKPTIRKLDAMYSKIEAERDELVNEIDSNNLERLKDRAQAYLQRFLQLYSKLLRGSISGYPDLFGETLADEVISSGVSAWPEFDFDFEIEHSDMKLYGGAQFQRLLHEFELVAHSCEVPQISVHEVAAALGGAKNLTTSAFQSASADIVQMKARQVLAPLIDILMLRCSYIMKRVFGIVVAALERQEADCKRSKQDTDSTTVGGDFLEEVERVLYKFVDSVETVCRTKIQDDLTSLTRVVDWDMTRGLSAVIAGSSANPTREDTKKRVLNLLHDRTPEIQDDQMMNVAETHEEVVRGMAAKLFAAVRFLFIKSVRNKCNVFFFQPMLSEASHAVLSHFRRVSDDQYQKIFDLRLTELHLQKSKAEARLNAIKHHRGRFKAMADQLQKEIQAH